MLATPPFGASSNKALLRANIKPPVELVVADLVRQKITRQNRKGNVNMKKLTDLLEHVEYQCLQGTTDKEITSVVYDSRKAEPGSLFLCIKGAVSDGHS